MSDPVDRVVVYLDESTTPLCSEQAPVELNVDTRELEDGEHVLRVEAWDNRGQKGVKRVTFVVRNGPAITVRGLATGDVVEGPLALVVHAFGGGRDENWEPSQAETPAPVPTWAWVVLIGVITWAMYYTVAFWYPEKSVADSPTYRLSRADVTAIDSRDA
ncbi:MAG: cytochrome C [Polyangiaceae bacterium]